MMVYVVRMAWYRDDSVTAIRDDVVISIVKTIHHFFFIPAPWSALCVGGLVLV